MNKIFVHFGIYVCNVIFISLYMNLNILLKYDLHISYKDKSKNTNYELISTFLILTLCAYTV